MEPEAKIFALKIGFEPGTQDPGRVFRAMNQLIDSVQDLDSLLARVVSADIESSLILEDIQSGSLISWFRQKVKLDDGTPYKNEDPESRVEEFLARSNREFFQIVAGDGAPNYEEIQELIESLNQMAQETDVLQLNGYGKVPIAEIVSRLKQISEALRNLDTGDSASYIGPDREEISLDIGFNIEETDIEDAVVAETITNRNEMILKIKKPDYLGTSQWQFRHSTGSFLANIEDEEWLSKFQERGVDVRPGDSLRVLLENVVDYDSSGGVIREKKTVLKVHGVIRSGDDNQSQMDLNNGES